MKNGISIITKENEIVVKNMNAPQRKPVLCAV